MVTHKYRIEFPMGSSIENDCVRYISDLISLRCFGEIELTTSDVPIVQMIGCEHSNNNLVLAEGVTNVSHWLSFRNFGCKDTNKLVQELCGESKETKREIARALKRVIGWVSTWEDLNTPAVQQLNSPSCGHILFDKKLRHRNITYMLDCDANSKVAPTHLTIADIHLTMTISKWMAALECEKEFITSTIPAVVNFVKVLREKLRVMEMEYSGTETLFDQYFRPGGAWIDTAEVDAGSKYSFKFTQKEKQVDLDCAEFSAVSLDSVSPLNISDIEHRAQQLIGLIDWQVPSTCNAGTETFNSKIVEVDDMWEKMNLPAGREVRKKQQIVSLLAEINTVLPMGGIAVEFCSGGGYVGIPLAVLRPDCTVLLTDMNTVSIMYAKQRVEALQLTNVKFLRQELAGIEAAQQKHAFRNNHPSVVPLKGIEGETQSGLTELQLLEAFHVGIALHACGTATDAVLRICTRAGASFVVSPCCYGFIQHQVNTNSCTTDEKTGLNVKEAGSVTCVVCVKEPSIPEVPTEITCACEACAMASPTAPTTLPAAYTSYPASTAFRGSGWQGRWFAALCSQADRTFWSHDARASVHNEKGRLAMRAVDADRLLAAQELGYSVYGSHMTPIEASVKNYILVGVLSMK